MGGDFVMGATLRLEDQATNTFSTVRKATETFKSTMGRAEQTTKTFSNSQGRLKEEVGRFASSAGKGTQATEKYRQSTEKLKTSMFSLKSAIMAVAASAAIKVGFNWLVKSNADMETYRNTLTKVMGSQEEAVKTLNWANKFASTTPFEIPEVVEATTRMQAYGLQAKDTLGIVGDMASVMGKDLMQAVEAIADAQTGELERMKEFGITKGMIEDQAKAMGKSPINKKGQITDEKAFNAALFALMEKRYGGGMALQSKTFKGMLSNAQDFVGTIGRTLGEPIFEAFKSGLGGIITLMDKVQDSGAIDKMAAGVGLATNFIVTKFSYVAGVVGNVFTDMYTAGVAFVSKNRETFNKIGQGVAAVYKRIEDISGSVFSVLTGTVIPKVVKVFFAMGQGVVNVANWIADNWNLIGPMFTGLAIAAASYQVVIKGIAAATAILTGIQKVQKAVMLAWKAVVVAGNIVTAVFTGNVTALNAALMANPIGIVVAALGLLLGVGILVYKNWESITQTAKKLWANIQSGAAAAGAAFTELGNKVKAFVDTAVQTAKDKIKAFTETVKKNEDAIKAVAATLGVIFGPALIQTGVKAAIAGTQIATTFISQVIRAGAQAVISGVKITASFIGSLIKTGAQAVAAGAKLTVSFIGNMIKAGAQAVIAGAKITASFVGSLIKTGAQAVIAAAKITGSLITATVQYAIQGWKAAAALGAQTAALIVNGAKAVANGASWLFLKGVQIASTATTWAITAAQWALNAAFIASPIGWVVLGIGALIAVGVLLYKNWDKIVEKAKSLWQNVKDAWDRVTNFVSNIDLAESGRKIMETLAGGIKAAVMAPVNAVKGVFNKVRELLPFSDAHEGPLSQLTLSGKRIMTTLGAGVAKGSSSLYKTMNTAFTKLPTPGGLDIAANMDIPTVPQLFTTLNVGTKFDKATAPTYSDTYNVGTEVNPAGKKATNNAAAKQIFIEKLIDKLELNDVGNKDIKQLVEEIIAALYEKLEGADDILSGADMGGLI